MQNQLESFPAVSDPSTMREHPEVRRLERDALLDSVELEPGQTILDIQAAGGFLSDEISRRLEGQLNCLCLEPCRELAGRLDRRYTWIDNPVENFFSISDCSIDNAFGLAGLHHSGSHAATIGEAFRVLKPGGHFVVCDVEEGSPIARWLDEIVDRYNPAGHRGNFLRPGALAEQFRQAGFTATEEVSRSVPWIFSHRDAIGPFFKGLFGLSLPVEAVRDFVSRYFDIHVDEDSVLVDWNLIYCSGRKPWSA